MFCISYYKTKSLFVPIIFHVFVNIWSVLLKQINIEMDAITISKYIPVILFSILFVFFVIRKLYVKEIATKGVKDSDKV